MLGFATATGNCRLATVETCLTQAWAFWGWVGRGKNPQNQTGTESMQWWHAAVEPLLTGLVNTRVSKLWPGDQNCPSTRLLLIYIYIISQLKHDIIFFENVTLSFALNHIIWLHKKMQVELISSFIALIFFQPTKMGKTYSVAFVCKGLEAPGTHNFATH